MAEAAPWAFVVIGSPILLGLALAFSKFRNRKASRRLDPNTPSDDPSTGM